MGCRCLGSWLVRGRGCLIDRSILRGRGMLCLKDNRHQFPQQLANTSNPCISHSLLSSIINQKQSSPFIFNPQICLLRRESIMNILCQSSSKPSIWIRAETRNQTRPRNRKFRKEKSIKRRSANRQKKLTIKRRRKEVEWLGLSLKR